MDTIPDRQPDTRGEVAATEEQLLTKTDRRIDRRNKTIDLIKSASEAIQAFEHFLRTTR